MTAAAAPSAQKLVLLVEDDPSLAMGLCDALEFEGFRVVHAARGADAIEQARKHAPDCILLDLMLPDLNGYQVCEQIRRTDLRTPILMLTARGQEADKIRGLDVGADDYVTKPFSPRELVARVRARLRRAGAGPAASVASADPWITRGAFAIDREGHRIRYRQQLLDLTRYEYAVLDALLQRPGAILSRAQLMDRGWDSDADSADRTVDTHVKTLRAKLRAAGADPDPIRTHRGLGTPSRPDACAWG